MIPILETKVNITRKNRRKTGPDINQHSLLPNIRDWCGISLLQLYLDKLCAKRGYPCRRREMYIWSPMICTLADFVEWRESVALLVGPVLPYHLKLSNSKSNGSRLRLRLLTVITEENIHIMRDPLKGEKHLTVSKSVVGLTYLTQSP